MSLLDVKSLNAVPAFVIVSQFDFNFFKTESISSLYQIYILYKFCNGIFIIIIDILIKLSLFKCIFCIELYLNIVSNIYISIIYRQMLEFV